VVQTGCESFGALGDGVGGSELFGGCEDGVRERGCRVGVSVGGGVAGSVWSLVGGVLAQRPLGRCSGGPLRAGYSERSAGTEVGQGAPWKVRCPLGPHGDRSAIFLSQEIMNLKVPDGMESTGGTGGARLATVQNRSADRCLSVKVAAELRVQAALRTQAVCPDLPRGPIAQSDSALLEQLKPAR
jgi:hypothetical protein